MALVTLLYFKRETIEYLTRRLENDGGPGWLRYASGWVTGIERVRQHYSICSSVCSAGELAECRASVNDSRQSASANFRKRAVRVSPPISRFLADLRPQADASAVRTSLQGACYTLHGCMDAPTSQPALQRYSHSANDDHDTIHTHTHTHTRLATLCPGLPG